MIKLLFFLMNMNFYGSQRPGVHSQQMPNTVYIKKKKYMYMQVNVLET